MSIINEISQAKLDEVKDLIDLVNEYKVIGLSNVDGLPAKSLHDIRDSLRGKVVIRMFKKTLVKKAFAQLKSTKNMDELYENINGVTTILFTDMNPLKLASYIKSKTVKGKAAEGDIAPDDIIVKAGDTGIAPGPIISELNTYLKAATKIEAGTVHIRKDTVSYQKGEYIDGKGAGLLARLGIEPMTVQLDFYCAWEDGELLDKEFLSMDKDGELERFQSGFSSAKSLAIALGVISKETVVPLIQKAARAAIAVGLNAPMFIPQLLSNYVAKATAQANFINAKVHGIEIGIQSNTTEEVKQEEPEEEEEEEDAGGIDALFG